MVLPFAGRASRRLSEPARPERRRRLVQGAGLARPRRLVAPALLGLAAAPPSAGSAVSGSAQPAPGLARALGELGIDATAFAELAAAAPGLAELLPGTQASAGA